MNNQVNKLETYQLELNINHICLPVISQVSLIPKRMIKDPWDWVIMATSKYLDIPLMTKDKNISKSGLLNVVW
jgi:PIN domain nuclease of toxin-antitoxin system